MAFGAEDHLKLVEELSLFTSYASSLYLAFEPISLIPKSIHQNMTLVTLLSAGVQIYQQTPYNALNVPLAYLESLSMSSTCLFMAKTFTNKLGITIGLLMTKIYQDKPLYLPYTLVFASAEVLVSQLRQFQSTPALIIPSPSLLDDKDKTMTPFMEGIKQGVISAILIKFYLDPTIAQLTPYMALPISELTLTGMCSEDKSSYLRSPFLHFLSQQIMLTAILFYINCLISDPSFLSQGPELTP